jgi:phosphonate dehydrogenase
MTIAMHTPDRPPRVVITNWVHQAVIDRLTPHCEVIANSETDPWPRHAVAARAAQADGIMAFMPDHIDAAFLDACPRLTIVAGALKGYDNFDVSACSRRGVWFTVVPDLLTEPTAELAIGLAIALGRNVLPGDRHVRSGRFAGWRPRFYGQGLMGARVGMLGMGQVGRAIARRVTALGAEVVWWDPYMAEAPEISDAAPRWTDLDTLLATSTFVMVALRLSQDTHHLINANTLKRMRPDACLINPSRGSIVDEGAVADALDAGQLAGYAADAFEMEDWARDDRPATIDPRLRSMQDRTVFTPHLGSAIGDVREAIALRAADNLVDALVHGQAPRDAVNRPEPR